MKYFFVGGFLVSLFFNGYLFMSLKNKNNDIFKNIKTSVLVVRHLEAKVNKLYISKGKEPFVKIGHLTPEYENIEIRHGGLITIM